MLCCLHCQVGVPRWASGSSRVLLSRRSRKLLNCQGERLLLLSQTDSLWMRPALRPGISEMPAPAMQVCSSSTYGREASAECSVRQGLSLLRSPLTVKGPRVRAGVALPSIARI